MEKHHLFTQIYETLYNAFGPCYWWPGDSPIEVSVGAILTQNTAWKNVEKAIQNLKENDLLSVSALHAITEEELSQLIRSSGYFNQKARKIKAFIKVITEEFDGSLVSIKTLGLTPLRNKLLEIHGIGEETADSIMLYALDMPSFVIDAYTRRIFSRHGLINKSWTYGRIKEEFEQLLPSDVKLFNEYHALIVRLGHLYCRKNPLKTLCQECPLYLHLGDPVEL